MMLDLDVEEVAWRPPIKRTIASRDEGVAEVEAMEEHREYLVESGELQKRRHERTLERDG